MRVFAMMFAGLGGAIIMFATWEGLRRRRQERTGRRVRAKVVEIIVERILNRGGSGDMHFPVFEFVAADVAGPCVANPRSEMERPRTVSATRSSSGTIPRIRSSAALSGRTGASPPS
jgi:hypothetical protein